MTPSLTAKDTLRSFLDKLTQDSLGIKSSVARFDQDLTEAREKAAEIEKNIDRHQGALNYNSILMESVRKQLEEMEKAEIAAPAAKPPAL
jgi:chromosome segregation ATPase